MSRRVHGLLVLTLFGCPDEQTAPLADPQTEVVSLDVGTPDPPVPPPLPAPPSDPWAEAGLGPLRNGASMGWPVEAVHVTSNFGWRTDPVSGSGTRLHRGTDFRGETGDLVLSVAGGTVVFTGQDPALGTMVVVDHGLGITSLYGHLSDVLVPTGITVERGAAIGLVGNSGRSAAPHLHLTLKLDDVAVDPMMLLGQPLHRATALRAQPPRTRAPAPEPTENSPLDPDSARPAPVLQP